MDEKNSQIDKNNLKTLRTYTSDMAEAIRNNEISVAKIAMDEKNKREEESYLDYEPRNNKKLFFIISGVILFFITIAIIYFVIQKSEKEIRPITTGSQTNKIISYETFEKIDVTNVKDNIQFISLINRNSNNKNGVKAFHLIEKYNEEESTISTEQLFNKIAYGAPMSLIRTLSEEYLLGEYSNNGQNSKFLILRMNDYDQGYSSMLVWEKTMEEDFTLLFQKENVQQITNEGQKTKWEDLVIDNRDVRILRKDNGEILIYYLFINKDELIITNNLDTLKELTTRILIKK